MNWKLAVSGFAMGVVLASAQGCASDTPPTEDDAADAEETGATADELSANAKKLVGAFHGEGSVVPPSFQGLVFKSDGTFFADLDTGIRCITTPCPSSAHLEGKYTATASYLRLTAKGAGGEGAGFYGRYRYTLVGKKLTLTRAGFGAAWKNTLSKENTYCQKPADCQGQDMIVPSCMGSFTCGAGIGSRGANQCGWKCGVFPPPPSSQIWPASATKLVAESPGGGFTPPPPPGSTCAIGRQKYTFDVVTKKVAWEKCDWNGSGAPLTLKTGETTLTAAEVAAVNAAMNAVTLSAGDICGADKPMLSIKVTTPAGEKTYTDSFYSCMGGGRTYVDHIDGVFAALRDAVQ